MFCLQHSTLTYNRKLHVKAGYGCPRRWGWISCLIVNIFTWFTLVRSVGETYNYTLAFLIAIQNNGSGKIHGGAFFLALEHLNKHVNSEGGYNQNNTQGRTVNFQHVFRDTQNKDVTAMRIMTDLHCNLATNNITAFIGPDIFCSNAALMATAFGLPYLTYHCDDIHRLEQTMEKFTVVNLEPSTAYAFKYIMAVLKYYKWTSYWLVAGVGNPNSWTDIARLLKNQTTEKHIVLNGESNLSINDRYSTHSANQEPYLKVIENSRYKTRVYVFIGNYNALLDFVRALDKKGVTSEGNYVVIAVDDRIKPPTKENHFLRQDELGNRNVSQSDIDAFRNVLLIRRQTPKGNVGDFAAQMREKNYKPPINARRPPTIGGNSALHPEVPPEAYYLYDAVMYYGLTVLDLLREDLDSYNATFIVSRLRNVTRDSVQGFKVRINDKGASEGSYTLFSLVRGGQEQGTNLWPVGNFTFDDVSKELVYTEVNNLTIAWVSGAVPISNPPCGFEGCKSSLEDWKLWTLSIVLALVLVMTFSALFVGFRHYRYEHRLDSLTWKIDYSAIQLLDAGQLRQMISPGRPRRNIPSRWKTFLASTDMGSDLENQPKKTSLREHGIRVGIYKGSHVAVRQVTRKHVELNRALKKALLVRKDMNHENINRFIAACLDPPRVFIVTQFCTRRSLQDILKNEDSPLDDMFITSLVQDLHRGMTFIHESEFGFHGNLKSSKCLVDSRWVLKIADFGLGCLAESEVPDQGYEEETYCSKFLWRAPELLRKGVPPPQGTQKGDVYSFGIILYELYGKQGPWGDLQLSSTEIVSRLRSEDCSNQLGVPPLRPDTSVLKVKEGVVPLMKECWHPDPDQRPDFKTGIKLKLKPIQQGLLKSNIFDNMLAMMEKHAHNLEAVVAERTEQLSMEKCMTENLLLRMLPRSVAEKLKHGQPVQAEQYELVSIYFSDIVGFTELSAQSTPMQIVDMLNDIYTCFDSILENYDVYKVETIGDAYMVVSGLPIRNDVSHAGEVASMSLHLLAAITNYRIPHLTQITLKIRIGIHSGPCCAGVVGLKMPRYCLFGDTVNTASRMESTGEALKIHCSQECKDILDILGGYHLQERGLVDMKGKGKKFTYFLQSEDCEMRMRRIRERRVNINGARQEQRCVSTSNLDYTGKIYSMQNGMLYDFARNRGSSVNRSSSLQNTDKKSKCLSSDPDAYRTRQSELLAPSKSPTCTTPNRKSLTVSLQSCDSSSGSTEKMTNLSAALDINSPKGNYHKRPDIHFLFHDGSSKTDSKCRTESGGFCEELTERHCLLNETLTKTPQSSTTVSTLTNGCTGTPETNL